ncbi:hypothetical protein [Streptomyces sp. NPDC059491]|uniref:hypothetical protein n=1 Tax=Streptomyces sp. NPDC059491 TaxID=3346850 RepID=UPI00367D12CF
MLGTAGRARRGTLAAAAALLLSGCTVVGPEGPARAGAPGVPVTRAAQDELLRAAEHRLVVDCLGDHGITLSARPRAPDEDRVLQAALFGAGPRELSVTLATGATVTAHEDGCLGAARQRLYGDQRRWFRVQVTVDNLRAEAQARLGADPAHRAALARWTRCAAPPGRPRPDRPDPAVAARCARESGLDEVRRRLEPAELARVRTLHRDELTAYRQLRERALLRAIELPRAQTPDFEPAQAERGTSGPTRPQATRAESIRPESAGPDLTRPLSRPPEPDPSEPTRPARPPSETAVSVPPAERPHLS